MDWVLVATMGLQRILWINGAAGAGKSAIARSIVDMCLKREIDIARFFFFRMDSTRNTIQPFVATLAYQLIRSIPALDAIISPKIQSDPLIFNESLETQFDVLIFKSLQQLHRECPLKTPIVFLVDGIDECSGHENQVNIIDMSQKSFFQYVKRYGCIWSHQSVSSRAAISTEEPSFWAIQSLIRHDTRMRVYQYVQGNAVEYKC